MKQEEVVFLELHKSSYIMEVIFTSKGYVRKGCFVLKNVILLWQKSNHTGLEALMLLLDRKTSVLPSFLIKLS